MHIDRFNEIMALVRAAEGGSLSAAARSLDVAPSTISKLITRLENRLGMRLVNRSSRAMSLTQEGRVFYDHALQVISALEEADGSVTSGSPSGLLRVHC